MRFPIESCCINGKNCVRFLFSHKMFGFEIQKCDQILYAHKPSYLMPGDILYLILAMLVVPHQSKGYNLLDWTMHQLAALLVVQC